MGGERAEETRKRERERGRELENARVSKYVGK